MFAQVRQNKVYVLSRFFDVLKKMLDLVKYKDSKGVDVS
ncbi:hypothetical protein RV09_GL001324 [Enterococcus moraviensis]|nr:hypothetical protein RV09_GL001324 [Enterococcus moraviensis]